MRLRARYLLVPVLLVSAGWLVGCHSSSSSTTSVDDYCIATVTPSTLTATASSGKTYRVQRNETTDDIYEYQWTTSYTMTLSLNSTATSDTVDLAFPVKLNSATPKVDMASGGVVVAPTGSDTVHYESTIYNSTGNSLAAVGSTVSMSFQVWYTLPSGGKEALITTTVSLTDNDGTSFTKYVYVNVNP